MGSRWIASNSQDRSAAAVHWFGRQRSSFARSARRHASARHPAAFAALTPSCNPSSLPTTDRREGGNDHAVAEHRHRRHHAEIPARQIRHRRRGRDHLYPRLRPHHAGAGHLGDPQCHAGCRAESQRHRRHAVLFRQRFHHGAVPRRRSRHPAELLHGRAWRRVLHRGADRHRHRRDRGRHVQMRGDLPLDERLFAGAHRRHRRALGRAGQRRPVAQPRLWLAERRARCSPPPSCATCTTTAPSRSKWRW